MTKNPNCPHCLTTTGQEHPKHVDVRHTDGTIKTIPVTMLDEYDASDIKYTLANLHCKRCGTLFHAASI